MGEAVNVMEATQRPDDLIEIKIKVLESLTHTLQVDKCIPIMALKEQIASVSGVLTEQQRLIFCGRLLRDDEVLSDYNVENGHSLHLVTRPTLPETASNNAADDPALSGSDSPDNDSQLHSPSPSLTSDESLSQPSGNDYRLHSSSPSLTSDESPSQNSEVSLSQHSGNNSQLYSPSLTTSSDDDSEEHLYISAEDIHHALDIEWQRQSRRTYLERDRIKRTTKRVMTYGSEVRSRARACGSRRKLI